MISIVRIVIIHILIITIIICCITIMCIIVQVILIIVVIIIIIVVTIVIANLIRISRRMPSIQAGGKSSMSSSVEKCLPEELLAAPGSSEAQLYYIKYIMLHYRL